MAATMSAPPESALRFAEKNFRPAAVEADLYTWWERSGFFTPDESDPDQPFVMMLPLPNVTGDLHLGHALGFGGYEDLMARWHRMKGEPTLWMPGTDHAGIIAQVVVENELAKEGITRQQLGREKFLAEMWRWMDHYRPRIDRQLRMLGCSLDWSRPNFTMDPAKQRAVRTHFIRLHKHGHLYRDDRIVHWCVRDQTTYSDLEAKHVERTDTLYYVRYPWADPMPPGTPDVVIATTRPETIVADVAVAVHPDDQRWKAYVGKEVLVPAVERRIRIIADEAVDREFGTGALKITPGHDATDFEIGQRHGLQVLSVIDKRGMMTPSAGPLAGPDRDTARRQMVELLRGKGLLEKEEPITHSVGVHDRCGTVDERTSATGRSRGRSGGDTPSRSGTAETATTSSCPRRTRRIPRAVRAVSPTTSIRTPTCSTPGSRRRSGRTARSAGPTRRPTCGSTTRARSWRRATTSSSSGSRA